MALRNHTYSCTVLLAFVVSKPGHVLSLNLQHFSLAWPVPQHTVGTANATWAVGEFSSPGSTFCADLFRYPFHPRVTAVARKRPRSFCQKCRWQVTARHACTLRMWLCMKWHGAWLYGVRRTRRDGRVSCGTSYASTVSTPLRWIFKNAQKKSYSLM